MANIYLDYNATSPLLPEVAKEVNTLWQQPLNASSMHAFGRDAKKYMEEARKKVAAAVGTNIACGREAQVIFTASGTEANNLALKGIKNATRIISAIEHPSVLKTAKSLDDHFQIIPVDTNGVIKLDVLERLLKSVSGKIIVSVMFANNETGVIQPIAEVAELSRRYNALVHTDAVQAFGRIPVDMYGLEVDMITVSSHKIGGLQGSAALIIKKNIPLIAQTTGGGQELGFRAGTENIPAIHGFGIAAGMIEQQQKQMIQIQALRDRLEQGIKEISSDILIAGEQAARLPNTSCIIMPGVKSETQLIHFDLEGIAVSAGSACSSGKVDISPVLLAMGMAEQDAGCALRVSLGRDTKAEDIEKTIQAWKTLYNRVATSPQKVA